MKFNTRELIFIALMGALLFIINFSAGGWVIAATGIPGGSAFVTGFTNLMFVAFVGLTVRKFGVLSLMYLIYGILALPTHMAGGPPGFVWKILPLVIGALVIDICIKVSGEKKGLIIGLPLYIAVTLPLFLGIYYTLGMPEFDKMLSAAPVLAVAFLVLGYLGMWAGFKVHQKLKNKRLLKQLTA